MTEATGVTRHVMASACHVMASAPLNFRVKPLNSGLKLALNFILPHIRALEAKVL